MINPIRLCYLLFALCLFLPEQAVAQNPKSDVTLPQKKEEVRSRITQTQGKIASKKQQLQRAKQKPQTQQTKRQIAALERDLQEQENAVNGLSRELADLDRQIEAATVLSQMRGEYNMLLSVEKNLAPQTAKDHWQAFLDKYNKDLYGSEDDTMRAKVRAQMQALATSGTSAQTPPIVNASRLWTNSIGMKFVLVAKGSFMMGSPDSDKEANSDEKPQHRVNITQDFYVGQYEVTQGEWEAVMGFNPSRFKGANRPVENVSWEDVQEFIRKLNEKEGTTRYRLLTEAEWEYAARAGSSTKYSFGDDPSQLCQYGNVADEKAKETNSDWTVASCNDGVGAETAVVGRYRPNAWGLYDMHGNVWEWVQDWYQGDYYKNSPSSDSSNLTQNSNTYRVLRGGSWDNKPQNLRAAYRSSNDPSNRYSFIGFRLAKTL